MPEPIRVTVTVSPSPGLNWLCRQIGYCPYFRLQFNGRVPKCCYFSSYKSMKYPTPGLPLIATNAMCLGMAGCYDSYAILVAFKYPLIGVRMTSRWPALISPSPNIMIGVIEMIVMMMMEVKTSKHIVDTDRQLSSELLLILTWHSLFFMMEQIGRAHV